MMPTTSEQLAALIADFGAFTAWSLSSSTSGPNGDGRVAIGTAPNSPLITVPAAMARLAGTGSNIAAVSATISAQPASPTNGAVYILPAGKTGAAWGGMANGALAYWRDGAWEQIAPREGWLAYAQDADQMLVYTGTAWAQFGSGVTDGNKGAITVLGSAWSINSNAIGTSQIASGAVTYAKIQNISASDRVLGRQSAGAGPPEEIPFTAAARALCDDADAAAMRATLGLGSAATYNIGTSGANVALLNGVNSWAGENTFLADLRMMSATTSLRVVGSGGFLFLQATDLTAVSSGRLYFSGPNAADLTEVGFNANFATFSGVIRPGSDNTGAIGQANQRWTTVFATTGTINTSDAREKTALAPIDDPLKRAIQRVLAGIGAFQWLESVERKGVDGARVHIGVTAQAVQAAFEAEGLDPNRYALFCEDALTETVEVAPAEFNQDGELTSPARIETRPKFGADGTPLTRLGVRSDQLMWLALAAG